MTTRIFNVIIWSASVTLGCATGILTVAATKDVMNIIAIIQIYVGIEFPQIPFSLSHGILRYANEYLTNFVNMEILCEQNIFV